LNSIHLDSKSVTRKPSKKNLEMNLHVFGWLGNPLAYVGLVLVSGVALMGF